jgi:hypothetical protein
MNNTEKINYSGQVKVFIKNNKDKIVYSKNYHNSAGIPLFDFLLGTIKNEKFDTTLRPVYIKLFTNTKEAPDKTTIIDEESTAICSAIYFNTISNIESYTDSNQRSITLHFTIPCSFLNMSSLQSIEVKQAGLYCSKYAASNEKYSACFNFTDDTGTIWDAIKVSSSSGDYNIFIEWTLILQ